MRGIVAVIGALLLAGCGSSPRPAAAPGLRRLASPPPAPYLVFISVATDDSFRKVALASLAAPDSGAYVTPLSCDRVYFSAGRGICLTSAVEGTTTRWFADVFDATFSRLARIPLTGTPSRVRLSPDGRRAAATVFESGHAYDEHGFSTRTTIVDTLAGAAIGDLEQFSTARDGRPFKADDFNFWGVTFAADNDTFYATLQTGSISYLVKGSVARRTMEVVRTGVECPSLSPDNRRLAFKKRIGTQSRGWWQVAVLRLDTLAETLVTTESRSVDDQVEWLDDERLAYHLTGGSAAADLWTVRADASSAPRLLVPAAYSPAVVRAAIHSK
jgi:hypothetical protein